MNFSPKGSTKLNAFHPLRGVFNWRVNIFYVKLLTVQSGTSSENWHLSSLNRQKTYLWIIKRIHQEMMNIVLYFLHVIYLTIYVLTGNSFLLIWTWLTKIVDISTIIFGFVLDLKWSKTNVFVGKKWENRKVGDQSWS